MNAGTIGESSFKDFIQNQIESTNFNNETIKKSKLRNSDAAAIAKIMEIHGKDIAIKKERNVRQITGNTKNL